MFFYSPQVQEVFEMYIAASGLPEPRSDHAVYMAKFAIGERFCGDLWERLV